MKDEEDQGMEESPEKPRQRKAYTITKQRETWTEEEHQKFREALDLYGREWKSIEQYIGTKTVVQIRSHAQKFFMKLQKQHVPEQIPPARSKRRSSSGVSPTSVPVAMALPPDVVAAAAAGTLPDGTPLVEGGGVQQSQSQQQSQQQPQGADGSLSQAQSELAAMAAAEEDPAAVAAAAAAIAAGLQPEKKEPSSQQEQQQPPPPPLPQQQQQSQQQMVGAPVAQHMPWAAAQDTLALNPFLGNVAAFSEWLVTNGLLPPNQTLEQYAEQQQRQQEQLHLAQVFLQQAMGVQTPETDYHPQMPSISQRGNGLPPQPPLQPPADYSRVYSFLCGIFENPAPAQAQLDRLNELPPADRDLAQLMLHQMAVGLAASQLQEQFAAHLQQYRNTIAPPAPAEVPPSVPETSTDGTDH